MPTSDLDSFGAPGAWGEICSGRDIQDYVAFRPESEDRETTLRDGPHSEAEHLFEAANDGDTVAQEYLDQIAQYKAAGIRTLCNAYNPGLITISGGVALNNQQPILDGSRTFLDDYLYLDMPDIQITVLCDDIGLYGALIHAYTKEKSCEFRMERSLSQIIVYTLSYRLFITDKRGLRYL